MIIYIIHFSVSFTWYFILLVIYFEEWELLILMRLEWLLFTINYFYDHYKVYFMITIKSPGLQGIPCFIYELCEFDSYLKCYSTFWLISMCGLRMCLHSVSTINHIDFSWLWRLHISSEGAIWWVLLRTLSLDEDFVYMFIYTTEKEAR